MATGFGLAVHIQRHIGVFAAHFIDEGAQVKHGRINVVPWGEFIVVERQNKRTGPALLLGKLAQVAIAGDTQHFKAFFFNGIGQGADAQAGGVFRAEVFVDDDDGETKFHASGVCKVRTPGPVDGR
jgi:hypothetical protein